MLVGAGGWAGSWFCFLFTGILLRNLWKENLLPQEVVALGRLSWVEGPKELSGLLVISVSSAGSWLHRQVSFGKIHPAEHF